MISPMHVMLMFQQQRDWELIRTVTVIPNLQSALLNPMPNQEVSTEIFEISNSNPQKTEIITYINTRISTITSY